MKFYLEKQVHKHAREFFYCPELHIETSVLPVGIWQPRRELFSENPGTRRFFERFHNCVEATPDQLPYNATPNPRTSPLVIIPTRTPTPDFNMKLFPGMELPVVPPSTPVAVPELVPPLVPSFSSPTPVPGPAPPVLVGARLVSVTIENTSEPDTVATVVYVRVDGGFANVVVRIGPSVVSGEEAGFSKVR